MQRVRFKRSLAFQKRFQENRHRNYDMSGACLHSSGSDGTQTSHSTQHCRSRGAAEVGFLWYCDLRSRADGLALLLSRANGGCFHRPCSR